MWLSPGRFTFLAVNQGAREESRGFFLLVEIVSSKRFLFKREKGKVRAPSVGGVP